MFCHKIEQYEQEGRPLAWLDESGFAHDMPRTDGYSMKGERCYGSHDWGAKGRTNAIGALIDNALVAVGLLAGSVNTEVFTCWIERFLLPNIPAGCVIIMDNAAFHKGKEMQRLIENAGHILLYLHPYSPDLNPIEKKCAQAKHIRKSTGCSIDVLFNDYLS